MQTPTQRQIKSVPVLPGKWASHRVCSFITLFASFDAKDQFMVWKGKKTGVNVQIETEDGKVLECHDIVPASPQSVHIYWPKRRMDRAWLGESVAKAKV